MTPNILDILKINNWRYRFKKYLAINNIFFKYYFKSSDTQSKKLLLLEINSQSDEKILKEIVFYFNNYNNVWDIAVLKHLDNIESLHANCEQLNNLEYINILALGPDLYKKLSTTNINKKLTFHKDLDLNLLISRPDFKKELWRYIKSITI
tara:strand:+ start:1338 stop:1790 length:453 start_codon:yes stop_codon:yes gene_type:complete